MDPASASSSAIAKTENYLYFDPRSANARGTVGLPPAAGGSNGLTRSAGANAHGSSMPGGLGGLGSQGPGTGASFGQRRQGYADAVVFTVGGGSMDEYGNLQEWAKRTSGGGSAVTGVAATAAGPRKRVVYGSTEIVSAEEFVMGDLRRLGSEAA